MREIVLEGPVAETVTVEGRQFLYFGGTNYLGMAARTEVSEGARKAIDRFGLSSSASRTSTGTNTLHLAVESSLSVFAGTSDAIVLSSGYLAMQSLLEGVVQQNDFVLLQKSAHPSISQAVKLTGLPRREVDLQEFSLFRQALAGLDSEVNRILVVAEGVSALTGTVLPLPEILVSLEGWNHRILIDDAHGLGVAGENGRGTIEYHGCKSEAVLTCATLSKALGAFGGCVLADRPVCDMVRGRSLAYVCASPPSAADMGAALAALQLVQTQPQIIRRLHENAVLLKAGLEVLGFHVEKTHIPIVPIHLNEPQAMRELSERLFAAGILAPYIRYPGSPRGGLIRLAVTASHSRAQIQYLLDSLGRLV